MRKRINKERDKEIMKQELEGRINYERENWEKNKLK